MKFPHCGKTNRPSTFYVLQQRRLIMPNSMTRYYYVLLSIHNFHGTPLSHTVHCAFFSSERSPRRQ